MRKVIRTEQVTRFLVHLKRAPREFVRQFNIGYSILIEEGQYYDDNEFVKRIHQSPVPMSEIRIQGHDRYDDWRCFRLLVIHHSDDVHLIAATVGDKHDVPDWYDTHVPHAVSLYNDWLRQWPDKKESRNE